LPVFIFNQRKQAGLLTLLGILHSFRKALTICPYEIKQGNVIAPARITVSQLADSQALALKTLYELQPQKNKEEFEHYRLMVDIRMLYRSYQKIEAEVNDPDFSNSKIPSILMQLKKLLSDAKLIDQRFISLNKDTLTELQEENNRRNIKITLLHQRLVKERM